jgi:hypothetical protein
MDDTKPTVTNRSSWIAMTSDAAFDPIRASAVAHTTSRICRARSATRTEIRLASLQDIPATLFSLDTDPAFRLRCTSPLRNFSTQHPPCASGPMRTDRAALEQADWLLPESRACHWGTVISSST